MVLHYWDWLIIAVYAAVVLVVGLFLVRRPQSSEGYFLAGRQLRWPFIGASLFASNISAEHFVGLAGGGFALGMALGGFEWMAIYCLVPLIVLFLPFYIKNKIYTVPEFLEKRFSPTVRLTFSAFMVILSVLAKISISLWASSIVFSDVLGWDKVTVIWVVGLITAVYTMKGGLSAVVYTDALQAGVLLLAAFILTGTGLHHVGGWSGLQAKLGPEMFSMVKPATDPDLPWPGMFVGVFLLGSFYWSMDQVLVQRVFAAKTLNEGRLGAVFCACLKILTPFLLVMPGLIAKALYPQITQPDQAYPMLLKNLMPTGLLGLTVAGIAAALMGHLSATYNSIATLVTHDFYLKWKPQASQKSQIRVGRIAVLVVFIMGAFWAPVIGQFKSLFIYLQNVQAYLMMPFAGIFFAGVLWKRTNAPGVLACVLTTFIVSPILMYNSQKHFLPFMEHPLLRPWLHAALLAFILCMGVLLIVTLLTKAPHPDQLRSTTIHWSKAKQSQLKAVAVGAIQTDAVTIQASGAEVEEDNSTALVPVPLLKDYRLWLGLVLVLTTALWYWLR